ncbi:hypothetical protein AVEN_168131-1, partial [Araneus ventricosus]
PMVNRIRDAIRAQAKPSSWPPEYEEVTPERKMEIPVIGRDDPSRTLKEIITRLTLHV